MRTDPRETIFGCRSKTKIVSATLSTSHLLRGDHGRVVIAGTTHLQLCLLVHDAVELQDRGRQFYRLQLEESKSLRERDRTIA